MSRLTEQQSQQLDSMRALSAIVVLFGHTYQTMLLPVVNSWFIIVVLFSQLAVMVFFVLSGFLIGKSACNNVLRNSIFSFKQYSKDRALRIYPPLIAAILLMLFFSFAAPYIFPSGKNSFVAVEGVEFVRTSFEVFPSDIWGALAFLNGFKVASPLANSPLWSLSIEVWYYVLVASFFMWPNRKIASSFVFGVVVFITYDNPLFYLLAPVWFSGFLLALIHQRNPNMNGVIFRVGFVIASMALAAVIVMALFDRPAGNSVVYETVNIFRVVSGLWFAFFLALLLGGAVSFPSVFYKHASYSYTLYVVHFPVMLFIFGASQIFIIKSLANAVFVSAVTVLVCIIAAQLLSRWVESKAYILGVVSSTRRLIGTKYSG